jgi:pilus assembly protein CpaB
MRAVTIPVDSSSSFGGLVRPGDRVDVLFSARENAVGKLVALLQNVLILAVGQNLGAAAGPQGGSPPSSHSNQVTLSVTLEQAQILAYAKERGQLTLTLRNPDDIVITKDMPETTAEDLLQAERRAHLLNRLKPNKEIEHVQSK